MPTHPLSLSSPVWLASLFPPFASSALSSGLFQCFLWQLRVLCYNKNQQKATVLSSCPSSCRGTSAPPQMSSQVEVTHARTHDPPPEQTGQLYDGKAGVSFGVQCRLSRFRRCQRVNLECLTWCKHFEVLSKRLSTRHHQRESVTVGRFGDGSVTD